MTSTSLWKFFNDGDCDLIGYTLIIPSVAVGNVGQLASDLLISTLDMKKIASVYSPALIPVVGYDPYNLDSGNLSGSCEVYKCDSRNLVILQLRAPLVYKYAREFLEDVVSTFKEKKIVDIVILSSSFAHEKKHIQTSPFRYVATESCSYKNKIKLLNWMEHEFSDHEVKIFGGGFASLLFDICKEKNIASLILYKFCSEGDNIPDAHDMVQHLTGILPLFGGQSNVGSQLIEPVSWKYMFGRLPPPDIY